MTQTPQIDMEQNMTSAANCLDGLTPEQRELLMRPSRHLIRFQQFMAQYRSDKPSASLNEAQQAYQLACNSELAKS